MNRIGKRFRNEAVRDNQKQKLSRQTNASSLTTMISGLNGLIIYCLKVVVYRERFLITFHRFPGDNSDSNNLLGNLFAFDCSSFIEKASFPYFMGQKLNVVCYL